MSDPRNRPGAGIDLEERKETPSTTIADAARLYLATGWSPLPLPARSKTPPPPSWTGRGAPYPSPADIQTWIDEGEYRNVALRMPPGVVGLDVDHPERIDVTTLPATWSITARGADSPRRTYLFRVPAGFDWPGNLPNGAGEIIHAGYRYVVAPPSTHPDGGTYVAYGPDDQLGELPPAGDLPELPADWLAWLTTSSNGKGESEPGDRLRTFTRTEAIERCRPAMDTAREAASVDGGGTGRNNALNVAAVTLSHFVDVPGGFTRTEAETWLLAAATANGYIADKGRRAAEATIESGLSANTWKATMVGDQVAPIDAQASGNDARHVRLTPAASIKPRPVRWLWHDRLPVGELAMTPGRGGIGKSTFHSWVIAHITTGKLTGMYFGSPRACIIVAAEDSWERTIVPRLIAAGANMDRVYRADVVTELGSQVSISLPRDIAGLEVEISRVQAVLVSIDPLMSAVSSELNSHKDSEVRQALEPLGRLADRTGVTILGNAHFNKSGGSDPLSLIMGSAAFGNVSRAVIGFARDDRAEDNSCIISQVKNNLGRVDLPSLRYKIETATIDTEEGPANVGRLAIVGTSDRTVADVLRSGQSDHDDRPKLKDATVFLTERLDAGACVLTKDLDEEAREVHDISKRTLTTARQELGTVAHRVGKQWYLRLPDKLCTCEQEGKDAKTQTVASLPSCRVCGEPLDPANGDHDTHPNCEPEGS